MNSVKRFVFGVGSHYVYIAVTSFVALWLTPYTLSFVDKAHYGYYVLLADILTWINLLQFGVSGVFNSKAAMCIGTKDYESLQRYTSTTQLMQGLSSLLILAVGVVLSFNMDRLLDTTGISRVDVVVTFLIVVLTTCVTIIKQPLSAILVANKQIHIDNILNIGLYLFQTALTILFLNLGYSIISLATSHLIAIVVITLITLYRVKNLPFKLRFGFRGFDKAIFVEMFSTGIWFSVGSIGQMFIYKVDRFLIGSFLSLTTVTAYYITSRLYDFVNLFITNFVNVARPYFSQLYAKGEMYRLSALYDLFLNITVWFLCFSCTGLFVVNHWFVNWWIGDETVYLGDGVSALVALSLILQTSVLPNRALLASTLYKVKYQGLTRTVEGVLKFLMSLLLIRQFSIMGLLIASVISCLLCSTLAMNYMSNRLLERSIAYQLKNYLPYISVVPLLVLYLAGSNMIAIAVSLVYFIAYPVVYWRIMISAETRTSVMAMLRNKKNKKQ